MLADAVAKGEGVGVFESGSRSILMLLAAGMPLCVRLGSVHSTVPLVAVVLDLPRSGFATGAVVRCDCFRFADIYVPELRDLIAGLDRYHWDIGTVRIIKWLPIPLTYLIGVPSEKPLNQ